ncbi:MAG: thiolase family protein [Burkholderiaceae bacterium]
MPEPAVLIAGWARSPIAPRGGAFRALAPHPIAAPVLTALLARAGVADSAIDAVVMGNALGAGGNPARLVALAAGLPDRCAAMSVDSQCCAGLDAVAVAAGLIASGQAEVVVAGGVEAWSRSPIRIQRPVDGSADFSAASLAYERPAFAPDPARDPDLLQAAARYALRHGITRAEQDAYAVASHARALASRAWLATEIVALAGLAHDAYPRAIDPARAARMPAAVKPIDNGPDDEVLRQGSPDCSLSPLSISAQADGAALVLLASPAACQRLELNPRLAWVASASVGGDPAEPMLSAEAATRVALARAGMVTASELAAIELHDAFAVQGLSFCRGLGLEPERINRHGGGIARGHPIGASGAVALVRVLADLSFEAKPGARGLAAVAGAGGIGAAALVGCR